MNKVIYKICSKAEWDEAQKTGFYEGSSDDKRDGYIHFSTHAQVEETAQRYFSGRNDVILCAVETGPLGENLRYESSRGGNLFPHLYAPLPLSTVLWAKPITLDHQGALLIKPLLEHDDKK
jgi:uncharacterized protein (DUF952 family)